MNVNPAEVRQLVRFAMLRTGSVFWDEDLTQEVCMRAIDAFRRAGEVHYPRAFLMKIVLDTVRDHWRRRRPTEDIDALDERLMCCTPEFEKDIDRARKLKLLRLSLKRLEPTKRRIIESFYLDGLSVREIAERERRGISAVKMDLVRGRARLAELMGIRRCKRR